MTFFLKVKKTIQKYQLLAPGDSVLIGVSGGPDSVALLYCLHSLRSEFGLKIMVGHINHQLRKSAATDERFVQQLCQRLNLPCHALKVKIKKSAGKSSIEEIAREKRMEGLIRLAKSKKADAIALGHQQDDVAETVLMRMLRGSGLQGLQGILARREIRGFKIIRPLLEVSRKDVLAFLKLNRMKFRTDPTNRQTHFFRNKIRQNLLPLLEKQYQGNIKELLAGLANTVGLDYDFLNQQGQQLFERMTQSARRKDSVRLNLSELNKLHPSQRRTVLRLCVAYLKGNLNRLTMTHMEEMEDLLLSRPAGSVVHLPQRIAIRKDKNQLCCTVC